MKYRSSIKRYKSGMDKLVAFKFNGKHPSAERNMRHNVMFKVEETGNKNVADTVKKHSKTSSE